MPSLEGPQGGSPKGLGAPSTRGPPQVCLCFPTRVELRAFFLAFSLMYVKILKALVYYIKNYVSCSAFSIY